jgi:hypothetical protein
MELGQHSRYGDCAAYWATEESCFECWQEQEMFLRNVQNGSGIQPVNSEISLWEEKRPQCEAGRLRPHNVEVKYA